MEEETACAEDAQPSPGLDNPAATASSEERVPAGAFAAESGSEAAWLQMLENPNYTYAAMNYGDVIEGIVMEIGRDEILVDIGAKSEGVVPSREFRKAAQAGELDDLKVGSPILVFVLRAEDEEGRAVLSIDRARHEKVWRWLEEVHSEGRLIEAPVDGYNKGGLLVNLRGIRGFVPISQIAGIAPGQRGHCQEVLAQMVGQTLPLKVIEINRRRNRLVLSQRQALQGYRESRKEELLERLEVGKVYRGVVSSICSFGVFVDLGGADGLVHLSELSWKRVDDPGEVVQVGQEVDVYVLGVDRERKRIALSIRRTQPEPWSRVAERYQLGQLVQGRVTQVVSFGAFVRLEDGIEGLVHLSELADTPVSHPGEVVREGEVVTLRVIRIDPAHRRIGLSLRRAQHDMGDPIEAAGPGPAG
ncbi:MAG: 30S ribosomal protein S1 [Chloroflexia bacterium]